MLAFPVYWLEMTSWSFEVAAWLCSVAWGAGVLARKSYV